jgi:hypothetical protein
LGSSVLVLPKRTWASPVFEGSKALCGVFPEAGITHIDATTSAIINADLKRTVWFIFSLT